MQATMWNILRVLLMLCMIKRTLCEYTLRASTLDSSWSFQHWHCPLQHCYRFVKTIKQFTQTLHHQASKFSPYQRPFVLAALERTRPSMYTTPAARDLISGIMSNSYPNNACYPSQQQSYPPHPQYPPTAQSSYPPPSYPPGLPAYPTETKTFPVQSYPVNTSQAGPSAAWQQQQPVGYPGQGSSSSAPWPQEQQQQQPAQQYTQQQPEGAVGADGSRGLGSSLLGAGHKVSSCSHHG